MKRRKAIWLEAEELADHPPALRKERDSNRILDLLDSLKPAQPQSNDHAHRNQLQQQSAQPR